jgi:hypothetical protein
MFIVAIYFVRKLSICHTSIQPGSLCDQDRRHCLDESFAPKAIHGVLDGFVNWSETNSQVDQLLGGILSPHHPPLLVLLNPDVNNRKKKPAQCENRKSHEFGIVSSSSPNSVTFGLGVQGKDRQLYS